MVYSYKCQDVKCADCFEVIKALADIDNAEACPKCGQPAQRYIARTHFYGANDWDKAEFNPGLGMVTRNGLHARAEAKARGFEEVGNEAPDKLHAHFDKGRKERYERRWADDREKQFGD